MRSWLKENEVKAIVKKCLAIIRSRRERERKGALERAAFGVLLALLSGMRIGAIASMTWGDFFSMPNRILVRRAKRAKRRWIRIPNHLVSMMREHRRKNSRLYGFPTGHDDPVFPSIAKEGKPITKRAMQKSMTKILAAFGFEKISVHALRRTFATALYEISNKNIELVRQQLGHEDCRTTQVYIQTVYDEQEKAIQGIYNLP